MKLARMWEFDGIYKYAVKKMSYKQICKTSAEKVGIAFQYDIKPWLLPAMNELAKREEPLGNLELELLGPELALKVAAVRESLTIDARSGILTSGSRVATKVDFTSVIKRVFGISGQSRLFAHSITVHLHTREPSVDLDLLTRLRRRLNDVDAPKKGFREESLTGLSRLIRDSNDVTYVWSSGGSFRAWFVLVVIW